MLGGDVQDLEITNQTVYAAYEDAVQKYSELINYHQAKNTLVDLIGSLTASFGHQGTYLSSSLSSSLSGANVSTKFPKFSFGYTNQHALGVANQIALGGTRRIYSASFNTTSSVQDYDLQTLIEQQSQNSDYDFYNQINGKRITIHKVYYKTPRAIWRFYGFYGGIISVGNLSTYGQYADDSTFQLVPVWQNKAQAAAYEDAQNTRVSAWSYEIRDNRIRIFPQPDNIMTKIWFEFSVPEEPWDDGDGGGGDSGTDGINNVNTLPFANLPYTSINSMGKSWIRQYALSRAKETQAYNRGKFTVQPIPGESVTLNHAELLSQAKQEQKDQIEQQKKDLDELTYSKLSEQRAAESDNVMKILEKMPNVIYVG